MHVAAIRDTGSVILGQRDLGLDEITGLREVSHRGGGTVWLYEGGLRLARQPRKGCAAVYLAPGVIPPGKDDRRSRAANLPWEDIDMVGVSCAAAD